MLIYRQWLDSSRDYQDDGHALQEVLLWPSLVLPRVASCTPAYALLTKQAEQVSQVSARDQRQAHGVVVLAMLSTCRRFKCSSTWRR